MPRPWDNVPTPPGTLATHSGRTTALAWSPDGTMLATGGDDSIVRLWDTASAEPPRELVGHDWGVRALDWSPDGTTLASASQDGTVILWDATTGEWRRRLRVGRRALVGVAFDPEGPTVAVLDRAGQLSRWQVDHDDRALSRTEMEVGTATCLAWSRHGSQGLAAGGSDALVVLAAGEGTPGFTMTPLQVTTGGVTACAWSSDGDGLLWGEASGAAHWLSPGDPEPVMLWGSGPVGVAALDPGPDGRSVAVAYDGTPPVALPLDPGGSVTWTDPTWTGAFPAAAVAWSPDGVLAIGGDGGELGVWDSTTGEDGPAVLAHRGRARDLAWSPDGTRLVSVGNDGMVLQREATGAMLPSYPAGTSLRSVAWAAEAVAVGAADGTLWWGHLGSDSAGQLERHPQGHDGAINDLEWSPDAGLLGAASSDGRVSVRDWDRRPRLGFIDAASQGRARALAWSPDAELVAVGDDAGLVRLWGATDGKPVGSQSKVPGRAVNALAWHPDGELLAIGGSDGGITMAEVGINVREGGFSLDSDAAAVSRISFGDLRHERAVTDLSWSPDGSRLASAGRDGTVVVWGTDGARLATISPGRGPVEALAWLPGDAGDRLATAGADGSVRLWDAASGAPVDLEDADPGDQLPQPEAEISLIRPDEPTRRDELRREAIVVTLAEQLRRFTAEEASFAIHLGGAWGSGKSSLVNLLEDELGRDWLRVDFEAWRHSRLAPAWWSVVTVLRDGLAGSRNRLGRLRLRLAEARVRLRRLIGPLGALVALVTLVAVVLGGFDLTRVLALAGAVVGVGIGLQRFVLWETPAGADLMQRTDRDPLSTVADHVTWLRSKADRKLLLVLEDLDRCEADYVVDVLEVVHTLVRPGRGSRPRRRLAPIVILAVGDAPWLRTAYEKRYSAFAAAVTEPGQSLGYLFQEKLFQLSLSLPDLPRPSAQQFLAQRLRPGGTEPATTSPPSAPAAGDGVAENSTAVAAQPPQARAQELISRARSTEDPDVLESVHSEALEMDDLSDRRQVLRAWAAQSVDPEVQRRTRRFLLERFGDVVAPNPRSITRLVSAYTLELSIHDAHGGRRVPRETVALWTIASLRFPLFVELLHYRLHWLEPGAGLDRPLLSVLRESAATAGDDPARASLATLAQLPELARVMGFEVGGPVTLGQARALLGLRVEEPAAS